MSETAKWTAIGVLVLGWMGVILALGAGRFGRDGTQRMIDGCFGRFPCVWEFFNRHHGFFRAAAHYVEFCTLTLLLYAFFSRLSVHWRPMAGLAALVLAGVWAYVDEWRQSRTAGRQFRRIDFIHSLIGVGLTSVAIPAFLSLRALL